jgi:hypothetical protein
VVQCFVGGEVQVLQCLEGGQVIEAWEES